MTSSGVCATAAHFSQSRYTGKERDTESGNDYFGARYYASNMGRFMSPDWSAKEDPVPYAKLDDPQTLNLYSYVGNNPLSRTDFGGYCCDSDDPGAGDSLAGSPFEGFTHHFPEFALGVFKGLLNMMPVGDCGHCAPKGPLNPPANSGEAQGMNAASLLLGMATGPALGEAEAGADVEGIFANPEKGLAELNSPEGAAKLGQQLEKQGWDVGTLKKDSHEGQGMTAIEYKNGKPTDRSIQWHPGGGRHGQKPYFKVSSSKKGKVRVFDPPKKPN